MGPAQKHTRIIENDRHVPSDSYRDPAGRHTAVARRVKQNDGSPPETNGTGRGPNDEHDVDDEEDFLSEYQIYFASGTVLRPSDEPYDLRSKINRANRELADDDGSAAAAAAANAPGKVKFDNTVVVLDSFADVGTVPVGTERLQGADVFAERDDPDAIVARVDLSRDDEDDRDDVVVGSAAERTQDAAAHSSTSFSRSFSSESDDPLFINVIESGDEFKTIMDRNNRTRQGSSAIDEHVTYFPELFTHAQYKIYEKSGKTPGDDDDDDDADIYVPKKLDADELRNKLKEISKGRKVAATGGGGDVKKASANGPARRKLMVGGSFAAQRKTKPTGGCCDRTGTTRPPAAPAAAPARPHRRHGRARVTYYFEMDPKGKLKPLNGNDADGTQPHANGKFFRINLKATAGDDGNAAGGGRARATKAPPATDLFLEFRTDGSGDKGAAKLVIKKKPAEGAAKKDRPRLPGYNGLRSEYGLSAEQLLERRRMKTERETRRKECRQKRHEDEQRKRAENEKNFYKWLQQKRQAKKQPNATRHSYPMNRLTVSSARNSSINFAHIGSQRKGSFALEELLKIKDENDGWLKF